MSTTPIADEMDTMNACIVATHGDGMLSVMYPMGAQRMKPTQILNLVAYLIVMGDLSKEEVEAACQKVKAA